MGLDGGTYITRTDVLRGQSWAYSQQDTSRSTRGGAAGPSTTYRPRQIDKATERHTKWSTCALSGQPLAPPLAADWLGRLYNRETAALPSAAAQLLPPRAAGHRPGGDHGFDIVHGAATSPALRRWMRAVLAFLLARAGVFEDEAAQTLYVNQLRAGGAAFENLLSKRDVFTAQLAQQPDFDGSADGAGGSRFECPATQLPCEAAPFAALAGCGHVLSERAIRQASEGACPVCSTPFDDAFVVPINGTPEQIGPAVLLGCPLGDDLVALEFRFRSTDVQTCVIRCCKTLVEKLTEQLPSRRQRPAKLKGKKRKAASAAALPAPSQPGSKRLEALTT